MSDKVIEVKNLSKRYTIGDLHTDLLSEKIGQSFKYLFNKVRRKKDLSPLTYNLSQEKNFWALKDVSFEIKQGEVVGIIGRNGAGKTTLLKILSCITEPTEGTAEIYGRVGSLLEVGTGFHPELSGRENIYLNGLILGMSRAEIKKKFDEIVAFAEVEKFLDTPVKRYSSGMYVRLAFAVAAHLEPEILLVDEVLAVGDAAFQKKCLGKMGEVAKEGRTVLFVSHNMGAIATLCNSAIYLEEGRTSGIIEINEAITNYMGKAELNRKIFDVGPLKQVCAHQVDDVIEIIAEYRMEYKIKLPCLGFVVSDSRGNPIFGTNPKLDAAAGNENPQSSGTVKVRINSPKLLNGSYSVTLWFGDGNEDIFYEKDCLYFEVVNMSLKKQLSPISVGPVVPHCTWVFE